MNTPWITTLFLAVTLAGAAPPKKSMGPLQIHPVNMHYFADPSGRPVYLTGSHTWNNLIDINPPKSAAAFDFRAYLNLLKKNSHNFIRLWTWESFQGTWDSTHSLSPQPWLRTGTAKALDGNPRFDLKKFNPAYFERLRTRVKAAREKGIYVSVMLFEGWVLKNGPRPWRGHPFNAQNNLNGIDGDPNKDGKGLEIHTWPPPAGVWDIQTGYVSKVLETLQDMDNVLYEICNQGGWFSTEWQMRLIQFIKKTEAAGRLQHPVGMTGGGDKERNADLITSGADWICPGPEGGYQENPPPAEGRQVLVTNSQNFWGVGGDRNWVWKSFCRGLNVIFLDPLNDLLPGGGLTQYGAGMPNPLPKEDLESIRQALGLARRYADRLNLAAMVPDKPRASSNYALSNPGLEYLIFTPSCDSFTVDLSGPKHSYKMEWCHLATGRILVGGDAPGGAWCTFKPPFRGDAVLYLKAEVKP